ncbi:universal stress protein [Pelagibius sp.]|uniref:universal stress protein n=1 Tax=Pelagibius sp. TaxID=1931238 RepID=UPI003B50A65D
MFKTVLVAVDGSGHAANAVRCAGDIAKTYDATLVMLAVDGHRPLEAPLADLAKSEDLSRSEVFERILASARILAEVPKGVTVEQRVGYGDPADEILDEAGRSGADLIVVGSRGLGEYAELLLGSVSRKVLHLAKVPVLVAQAQGPV